MRTRLERALVGSLSIRLRDHKQRHGLHTHGKRGTIDRPTAERIALEIAKYTDTRVDHLLASQAALETEIRYIFDGLVEDLPTDKGGGGPVAGREYIPAEHREYNPPPWIRDKAGIPPRPGGGGAYPPSSADGSPPSTSTASRYESHPHSPVILSEIERLTSEYELNQEGGGRRNNDAPCSFSTAAVEMSEKLKQEAAERGEALLMRDKRSEEDVRRRLLEEAARGGGDGAMARSMDENRGPEGWPMVDENGLVPVNGAHFQNGMVGGEKPADRPDVWDMADEGGGGGEPSRRAAADGEGEIVAAEAADPIPDAPREWPSWPGFSEGWVSEDPPPASAEEEKSAGAEEGGEKEEAAAAADGAEATAVAAPANEGDGHAEGAAEGGLGESPPAAADEPLDASATPDEAEEEEDEKEAAGDTTEEEVGLEEVVGMMTMEEMAMEEVQ